MNYILKKSYILVILPTHGLFIFAKFCKDCTKIVDFLLMVNFWTRLGFFLLRPYFQMNYLQTAAQRKL